MKIIIKISLLSLLTPLFAGAMQQNPMAAQSSQQQSADQVTDSCSLMLLPNESLLNIIDKVIEENNVNDAASQIYKNINALAQVNRTFYAFINNEEDTKRFIEKLSSQYQCSETAACLLLKTKGSAQWLAQKYGANKQNLYKLYSFAAAPSRHLPSISFLIHYFPNIVHTQDQFGHIPLHHACSSDTVKAVRKLIAAGSNINHADKKGITPLMKACLAFDNDIVQELLKCGADVSLREKQKNLTARELLQAKLASPYLDPTPDASIDILSELTRAEFAKEKQEELITAQEKSKQGCLIS